MADAGAWIARVRSGDYHDHKIEGPMSTDALNMTGPTALDLLLSRRSGSAKAMTGPGPSQEQLADILLAGARVPDHGKLFPWRFIIFEGQGLERFADILTEVLTAEGVNPGQIEEWRNRTLGVPVVVGVVSCARELIKIPVWEQE